MEAADNPEGLIDYKFYCFNGVPKYLYVSKGMIDHSQAECSFLNLDWTSAPFGRREYPPVKVLPPKPKQYDRMLEICKKLAHGIPFIRVDLYEINGKITFSELTFSPCGGFMAFDPPEYDAVLGEMLDLTAVRNLEK